MYQICNTCGKKKPADAGFFHRDAAASGGLSKRCKLCSKEAYKKWRQQQGAGFVERERERQRKLRQRPEQKEKARENLNAWRRKNPEKAKAQTHAQPHAKAERERRRVAVKLHATPAWADFEAIRAVYGEARKLTEETGIPHEVDHVIPLKGRLATGFHVHSNLRVITASENARKSNRLIPELLGEIHYE